MNQYCVYTDDKNFTKVINYISEKKLAYEPHLNRTRFWVPESLLKEFIKEWGSVCRYVHPDEDLITGHQWDNWKASKDLGSSL